MGDEQELEALLDDSLAPALRLSQEAEEVACETCSADSVTAPADGSGQDSLHSLGPPDSAVWWVQRVRDAAAGLPQPVGQFRRANVISGCTGCGAETLVMQAWG